MQYCSNNLSLLSFLSLLSLTLSVSTTTLTLTTTPPPSTTTTTAWHLLRHLSASSTTRAHHLKHPKITTTTTNLRLFPRSYGGYSISLSFGTPPQTLHYVMDTGSSLVWSPCTKQYACNNCNYPNDHHPANKSASFITKASSSAKLIGCRNPKCRWVFPNLQCNEQCSNMNSSTTTSSCSSELCPPYVMQYGSGSTTGLLMSDTLVLPTKKPVPNFVFGCSILSSTQPSGIAGFGRGPESLPSQLKLKGFSYCLVSHRFDNQPVSSHLLLVGKDSTFARNGTINHTPFRKMQASTGSNNLGFEDYYYVTLKKITVGGVSIKVPYRFLVTDDNGHGGAIIDSGTTFTFMESELFELVAREFEKQQAGKNYTRAIEIEKESGLRPCFRIISGENHSNSFVVPRLTFHFKGGSKMDLPLGDYFSFVEDSVVCMTIVTGNNSVSDDLGPSIVLGNYQQQNFYIEYDLENDRLGIRKTLCK